MTSGAEDIEAMVAERGTSTRQQREKYAEGSRLDNGGSWERGRKNEWTNLAYVLKAKRTCCC
jgi:hypothetical protein